MSWKLKYKIVRKGHLAGPTGIMRGEDRILESEASAIRLDDLQ